MEGRDVYILGGARSYIGVENGMYQNLPGEQLGANVLRNIVNKYSLKAIDWVIFGNAVGAGGNIGRLMTLTAGLPEKVPAYTVDMQCGSGLESISIAASKIACGQADCIVAGGFESSSTAPRRGYHPNHPDYGIYFGEDDWYRVAKFAPGCHDERAMLLGAEKTAIHENITREDLNPWVLRSHRLAVEARDRGDLKKFLVEGALDCNRDECIREKMSEKFLNRLPCILEDGKVLTAGNACLTQDGAAFVVLCSKNYLDNYGKKPLAKVIDMAAVGDDPSMSPRTAVYAIQKLLQQNHMTEKDISVFECNEAFAVIDALFQRAYPQSVDSYNMLGGALAYGHPYGASGGIITLHALKALELKKGENAVCSIAAAGGVGSALLLQKV